MIEYSTGSFPVQRLPMSKKTEAWGKACVDFIAGHAISNTGNSGRTPKQEMLSYYDLYNSIYNEKDLKYVTNPFNQDDGFPAMAQDYNIIKPSIDLLLGEETKRPFNFKVIRTSESAASDAQDQLKQMLQDYVMATIMMKLDPQNQQAYEEAIANGEILPPDKIYKYISRDYKDIAESTAQHSLSYLKQKLNLTHEFYKGFKDGLVGGEELYYVGIRNGEPIAEQVNPVTFTYDDTDELEFIHEAKWCVREMEMSDTEIYDNFYDKMSENQLKQLLSMIEDGRGSLSSELRKNGTDYMHIRTKSLNPFSKGLGFSASNKIKVWHACWKSYKKIGFITVFNEMTEALETFKVDENYKVTGLEVDVEWKWVIEVWEGYKIGDGDEDGQGLYLGIQPIEYQHVSADNPNSQRLPYTGVVYNNTNSNPRSLVSMMKPLQYMYIVLWYRVELAIARDKGKVPLIDVTQIPKSMGVDMNKWMHYLSALGVAFVNPYEEGWNIPGREGGKPSSFNQFQALDLSMTQTISQYIGLMQKIEDMVHQISGVTPQRLGAISSNELVGNVERSVNQSAHITEPWFWMHNQVKRQVLIMLLDTAKVAWKGNKEKLNYIFDDMTRAFLTLSDEFFYSDMDIFVDDSTKTQRDLETLRSFFQPAMQNGATLLDIAEIVTVDNASEIRNKLMDIEQERQQREAEAREAEQAFQQQMQEAQLEVQEREYAVELAKLDMQKYKTDVDNATRITVAELQAYRGTDNLDQDGDGIPDPIQIADQALRQREIDSNISTKRLEALNKSRDTEIKREIENKKIDLEKQKIKAQKELQEQKDKAALEREKLKGTIALQNKVVGEK